jgi:transglutaminase-like putative cysteine protease
LSTAAPALGVGRRRPIAYAPTRSRPLIRLLTFTALAGYGTFRWATLIRPAPGWRLAGVLALAVALAGLAPLVRRLHRFAPGALAVVVILFAFPVAGLPWQWFIHHKIALSVRMIGDGLAGLPSATVPYLGAGDPVAMVIVLGAAVLVLDAAAVLAFAPGALGDARRAAAALPLLALAVVPSTLIRPQLPYLQGLALFALLGAFAWGERVPGPSAVTAVLIAGAAGVAAALVAPRVDQRQPWINYRAWAAAPPKRKVDSFNWNQTYGPLRWPHSGHLVMTVAAKSGDYWKAADLDTFNGFGWTDAPIPSSPPLPAPAASARKQWTQTLRVTLAGIRTRDVISAGYSGPPAFGRPGHVHAAGVEFDPGRTLPPPSNITQGSEVGTYASARTLGPGATYEINSYSPRPTRRELATDEAALPVALLGPELTVTIPAAGLPKGLYPQVTFPAFHAGGAPTSTAPSYVPDATALVRDSPYARVYALARQLAGRADSELEYALLVERYLSKAGGFTYSQTPPKSAYPLVSFLFSTHRGYCQQFSGAMALLLRMGGVPARVAAGFTPGTRLPRSNQWDVSDIDAHAWVEVWFPRYGWVRFDPTPATAPARRDSTPLPIEKTLAAPAPPLVSRQHRDVGASSTTTQSVTAHHATTAGTSPWLFVLGAAGGAAILIALWAAAAPGDTPERLLTELERALARTRRPIHDGVTLAALELRLRSSPAASGYVRALKLARYAGSVDPPSRSQRRALRRELSIGLGTVGRVRALWALPPRPRLRRRRFDTPA